MLERRVAFGPFVLDREVGTLLREGVRVPVGYRGMLLLSALLSRPGEVLTKSDLIDAAWQGSVVEETNLSVQIAALRKHLGQAPRGGDWIATVPRVGYRFVGPVEAGPDGARQETVTSSSSEELAKPAVDRGAPLRQSQRRSGSRIFRRWHGRRHHHRARAGKVVVRDRTEFELHLQG
jgi:DNA-binding winged helix-turn-helix (wHTH) protein